MVTILPESIQSIIVQYTINDNLQATNPFLDIKTIKWYQQILKLNWGEYGSEAFLCACLACNLCYADWLLNKFGISRNEYYIFYVLEILCWEKLEHLARWIDRTNYQGWHRANNSYFANKKKIIKWVINSFKLNIINVPIETQVMLRSYGINLKKE